MQRQALKRYLIRSFLMIMLAIYVSGELISMLYREIIFPFLEWILEYQRIRITARGNVFVYMIQMLLYFAASFLPNNLAQWVQGKIAVSGGDFFQISVHSPFYYGYGNMLLRAGLTCTFLLLLGISLLPYAAGAVWYYKIVTNKVNELMEEEKENQLRYERRRNLLLSDIAHDIKTPITTICGYSKALSEGMVPEERRQVYLDAIYAKSMRMDELASLLFEYVKLGSEGYMLHKEQCDPAELLRKNVALLYEDFEGKEMALTLEIPEQALPCELDPLQMGRAIANLLTNAVRYGRAGGRVLVRLQDNVITVADDGEPIDPAFAEHIFEPFTRGDRARSTSGGTGLGLGIASQIVKMHGGTLELDCHFGEGYTKAFHIRLAEANEAFREKGGTGESSIRSD